MKSKTLKYITIVMTAIIFLALTLGFISTDRKPDEPKAIFLKINM